MNFFRELTDKPWLTTSDGLIERQGGGVFTLPTVKVGLRLFLVMATILFTLVVVVYTSRMSLPDWRTLPEPWRLWLNTAMLIASSIALQWGRVSAKREQIYGVSYGLLAAGVFSFAFVIGQVSACHQLAGMGYFAATNPSVAFFYMITGLHGVHLLGGLVAWGRTTAKVWNGDFEIKKVCLSVELCAIYWHFLLAVWLILFGLMLFT